jgi:hypothetical protein
MIHPFPDSGYDGEEPDGFPSLSADDEPGEFPAEQGLYVTVPAEQVVLAGFAQNGEADTMAPGALLAAIVQVVMGDDGAGLAACSDDQLAGIVSAAAGWSLVLCGRRWSRGLSSRPAVRHRRSGGVRG